MNEILLDRSAPVTGIVRDDLGAPVASATVGVSRSDPFGYEPHWTATTDERGAFTLEGLSNRARLQIVVQPGPWQLPLSLDGSTDDLRELTVRRAANLILTVPDRLRMRSLVLDRREGDRWVVADWSPWSEFWHARVHRGPLEPGTYRVRTGKPDEIVVSEEITLVAGEGGVLELFDPWAKRP